MQAQEDLCNPIFPLHRVELWDRFALEIAMESEARLSEVGLRHAALLLTRTWGCRRVVDGDVRILDFALGLAVKELEFEAKRRGSIPHRHLDVDGQPRYNVYLVLDLVRGTGCRFKGANHLSGAHESLDLVVERLCLRAASLHRGGLVVIIPGVLLVQYRVQYLVVEAFAILVEFRLLDHMIELALERGEWLTAVAVVRALRRCLESHDGGIIGAALLQRSI